MGGGGGFFGGGNFFQDIGNSLVNSVKSLGQSAEDLVHGDLAGTFTNALNVGSGAIGLGNIVDTPESIKAKAEADAKAEQARVERLAKADSDARLQSDALSTEKTADGTMGGGDNQMSIGALTGAQDLNQNAKQANASLAQRESQQSVNQKAGSGTLLTGNQGVDPQSLELGKKTLLGG